MTPPAAGGCTVIKVGGSACVPGALDPLLDWLEGEVRRGPVMVVCGGGLFADAVRVAQCAQGLDDATAHRQALLAMEQTSWAVRAAWAQRHGRCWPVAVTLQPECLWVPRDLLAGHPEIAEDWQTTSDSLAAWAARLARATRLLLLKSVDAPRQPWTLAAGADWARLGWVDGHFARHAQALAAAGGTIELLGRPAWSGVAAGFRNPPTARQAR